MAERRHRARRRGSCFFSLLASCALFGLFAVMSGEDGKRTASLDDLTTATSTRIDRVARETPLEELPAQTVDFSGDIAAWLIARAPMSAAEEREHALEAHAEVLARVKTAATPTELQEIVSKLLEAMPQQCKPSPFQFTVTVVDIPDPNAFTVGGGFLYISSPLLRLLLDHAERGRAALAFVIAHELGHGALGHCRRGYQAMLLEKELKKGIRTRVDNKILRTVLQTAVNPADVLARFLYSRQQEYESDLFALHLCRNVGYSLDQALDLMRLFCVMTYPEIRSDPEFRPVAVTQSSALLYYLSSHPDPLLRLKRLHMELEGSLERPEGFGLFLFDAEQDTFVPSPDGLITPDGRAIVFIHGLEGDMDGQREVMRRFAREPASRDVRLLAFRFPNDQSLSRSGKFLGNEMGRVCAHGARVEFVCHSAGGLVFRYYAEADAGNFGRAVFLGAPHRGSELVSLRSLLEAAQFAGDLRLGFPEALERSIIDGHGQILNDLEPDSLFLRYLDRFPRSANRYHVFRGKVMQPGQALAIESAVKFSRRLLERQIEQKVESPFLRKAALDYVRSLKLPAEISHGDLVVTLESADVPGAATEITTRQNHVSLKSDRQISDAVVRIVLIGNDR